MVNVANIPNPISRNKVTKSGRRFIILANNIAKITDDLSSDMATKKSNGKPFRTYEIKYPVYKLPKWFKDELGDDGKMTIWDSQIVKFSKNKKELQIFITANKYNL